MVVARDEPVARPGRGRGPDGRPGTLGGERAAAPRQRRLLGDPRARRAGRRGRGRHGRQGGRGPHLTRPGHLRAGRGLRERGGPGGRLRHAARAARARLGPPVGAASTCGSTATATRCASCGCTCSTCCRPSPRTPSTSTSASRARGLHGEAYRGHVFWDELFVFPVLNLRLPERRPGAAALPLPPAARGPSRRGRGGPGRGRCSRGSRAATAARRASGCTSTRVSGRWLPDTTSHCSATSGSPSPTTCGSTTRPPATSSSSSTTAPRCILEIARFFAGLATLRPTAATATSSAA